MHAHQLQWIQAESMEDQCTDFLNLVPDAKWLCLILLGQVWTQDTDSSEATKKGSAKFA